MTTPAQGASTIERTVTDLDPVFAQMSTATARHAWAIPQLTDREKVLLCITADVCHQTLGLPFDLHVRDGLARGVSLRDIRIALQFISYDTGYTTAQAAFEALDRLQHGLGLHRADTAAQTGADDGGEEALLEATLISTGPDAAPSPLPHQVRDQLRELDGHFGEYFDLQSRMRSSSHFSQLTERERAFLTMSIDVHYQTLGDTFTIHTGRAVRGGAGFEEVRAVVRFLAQFGATRAWQAWKTLNAVLSDITASKA